jgi:excinuclease UvrABC helicase subunit UvrB
MYGFKKTPSINEAMRVTEERRVKQMAYNEKNGITPKTVAKKVSGGVIEVLRGTKKTEKKTRKSGENSTTTLTSEAIDAKILELKQMMKEASQGLRFEEAASLRVFIPGRSLPERVPTTLRVVLPEVPVLRLTEVASEERRTVCPPFVTELRE